MLGSVKLVVSPPGMALAAAACSYHYRAIPPVSGPFHDSNVGFIQNGYLLDEVLPRGHFAPRSVSARGQQAVIDSSVSFGPSRASSPAST